MLIPKSYKSWFVLLLIVSSLTLFLKIGTVPPLYPWSDESEIAADAVATLYHRPQLFYPDQLAGGSLAVWLEAGWMALFGKSLLGLRLLNGFISVLTIMGLYLLIQAIPFSPTHKSWLALTAALFMSVSTWVMGLGRIATPNWSLVPLMTVTIGLLFWQIMQKEYNGFNRYHGYLIGLLTGLLFYGYLPGYLAALIIPLFLVTNRLSPQPKLPLESRSFIISSLLATLVAAPILIYFALHPDTLLQRPQQLSQTNELGLSSWGQSTLDFLATFGFWPSWLLQGKFDSLAFDPVTTILFVIGWFIALARWRNPAYRFITIWWLVMIAPAFLSRSASQGFIFEVWRRGIGAQPVSFIFPAIALVEVLSLSNKKSLQFALTALTIVSSATLGYWLYFMQWANSPVISSLFAPGPVQLITWINEHQQSDTLFLFPTRPNVSPTTRPELFTVRYMADDLTHVAFPVMNETDIEANLTTWLDNPVISTVHLMQLDRLPIDPKHYFGYALSGRGQQVGQQKLPDYTVTTYQLSSLYRVSNHIKAEPETVTFGNELQLVSQQIQPILSGQALAVAIKWLKLNDNATDYNSRLSLHDSAGHEVAQIDQPLLSASSYETSTTWSAGTASTIYYTLAIPPDLPPVTYTLQIVAYQADNGQPLAPIGGNIDLSYNLIEVTLPPQPQPIQAADLPIPTRLDATFANGLQLLGIAPPNREGSIRPGDTLPLSLWWRATQPLTTQIGLILALSQPNQPPIILAQPPQALIADFPTSAWAQSQIYRGNYQTRLPATVASGDYALALRLFDLDTLQPLGEQLLTPIQVTARPHVFTAKPLAQTIEQNFSELIRLRGAEFTLKTDTLTVKLQWQALSEITHSYKMFLHLLDAQGQIVTQLDTLPQQGAAPTTSWLPDEIITDELTMPIPHLPNSYRLVVGWYDEKSGQRLQSATNDTVILIEK